MTRAALAAVVLALAAAGAADLPTAPPPREKAAPPRTVAEMEAEVQRWENRAAWSRRMADRLGTEWVQAQAERQRVDALVPGGMVTPAERAAAQAAETAALRRREDATRMALADQEGLRDARERLAFAARRDGADVTGTIAVDVTFPPADRARVAVAALALIRGQTGENNVVADRGWDAARRGAHVYVRFPTPHRAAPVTTELGPIRMAELVVPLPLTREPGGFVLVRDVGRVVRVEKLPAEACVRFQEALAGAVPAGR